MNDRVTINMLEDGIAELRFDREGATINKFDRATLDELRAAVAALGAAAGELRGVVVGSGKEAFIVGADVGEFLGLFALPEEQLLAVNLEAS